MIDQLSYLSQYYAVLNRMKIISRTDTNGIITSVNRNFCKISGYSKAELVGFSHNKIRHPDTKDEVFKKMWQTITAGKIWQGEVKNATKKGKFYWTKSIIFPIFNDKKEIIEYMSFRENITSKKHLELKLEKEDQLRREILHSQSNMVILVHKRKGIIFMNDQCFTELPFKSRVDFMKEHQCICELFIEKDGFLKQSTPQRHWLEDFSEYPESIHKAIILNKEKIEQIYHVNINEFKDNKNLTIINLLNITEFENNKDELDTDQIKINSLELKVETALKVLDKELANNNSQTSLLNELKTILA